MNDTLPPLPDLLPRCPPPGLGKLAWVGRGILPIDGWHRITKGVRAGITDLPIWILNKQEAKSIRVQ